MSPVAPSRPPAVPRPEAVPVVAPPPWALDPGELTRRAAAGGTPITTPLDDGIHADVTFVHRGTPATRAVLLLPNKVADPRDWPRNLMARLPGTELWQLTLRMRRDWLASYLICADEGGPGAPAPDDPGYWTWLRGRGAPDPLNRGARLPARWHDGALSTVRLDRAPAEGWAPDPAAPRGTVAEHRVAARTLGNERRVWTYTPPGAPADVPVLVLFDGEMWQPKLNLAAVLDTLIADGRTPPIAAVLPESLGPAARWAELACNDDHVRFLTEELLPWAADTVGATRDPARTVAAGQSLGGLAAAHAALRAPHRIGNVLAQSASFWWPGGDTAEERLVDAWAAAPPEAAGVRFHLSAGAQEWVLLPANRRLRDVLTAAGRDIAYTEYNGGHDYLWWRTALAAGLVHLGAVWPSSSV